MKLIITIPARDEEQSLPLVIREITTVMHDLIIPPDEWDVVVVDDGSKDETRRVCQELNVHCISHPKSRGLATVFRTEMRVCLNLGADIILHIDADGQYRAEDIPLLLKELENYDLVLGSRFLGEIESMPIMKKFGNKAFSKVISYITKYKITDGQTGFRAFTRQVAKEVIIRSTHTYTQEQIIRAARRNFRIIEVPIIFRKRKAGKSRLIRNPFEYALKAWINLFRIFRDFEPLKFFSVIGILVSLPGVLLASWLVYLHFTSGIVGHIFAMMLMVVFFLSGLQIILFGFIADMRRDTDG